ncbi:MAG: ferric reductase-like transmembrane domain-containing protein [Spirochaetales bacterium]|nr:ferric reductase-like transmembrane domain-containing protein [Spirochaetales bacterium]
MRGYFLKGTLELLLSLVLAGIIPFFLGKNIRKKAHIWYVAGWVIALGTLTFAILTRLEIISVSSRVQWVRVIRAVLSGYLPAAIFIYVMWAGALPKGSSIQKKFMSIRSEMSILGSILYIPHALYYCATAVGPAVTSLLEGHFEAGLQIMTWAGVVNTVLLLLLGITSAKSVRKKMSGKKWKSLQKWAYLFYFFTYAHGIAISLGSYNERAIIYTLIFGAYFIVRVRKAIKAKKK